MKRNSGQLLLESLVAITMIIIAITGIFTLLSRSLSLTRVASDQYTGTYLAAEGVELIKNKLDTNVIVDCQPFNAGISSGVVELNYDGSPVTEPRDNGYTKIYIDENGFYVHNYSETAKPTKFLRRIEISDQGDKVEVDSKVKWKGRDGVNYESHISDTFYGWRGLNASCL
ncbi:MAG: hypothetical protein COU09_00240 [Candidatus Harrisonbacteria bacterium CG10_big_fil_rev_8_21_14_0_10_44_23]|uniref:Type 4 fimbrial biogenesis protein PilX N-terminal domain-containing protein n=1 Tax=Candidatus Harrisonbacteria bacterium CG10_big_fil_rev_8_21_14_0_10_44_23 TaxID=1974585 RepID=A0A2H0UR31_9BACT|nr:MAG: hypothetical protein COU09_00240 [Candidatus Harrisonbacteria bacterium CG10_big_fil_rev_8_21_14_0_10_44_23]